MGFFTICLWNDKGDKIKRNVMINDYPEGGLKMIGIDSFNKSLKAIWIKKYVDMEGGKPSLILNLENMEASLLEILTKKTPVQSRYLIHLSKKLFFYKEWHTKGVTKVNT